jgi:hypothetical protein
LNVRKATFQAAGLLRVAVARAQTAAASTPAYMPSADTPTQIAVGASTANGSAALARRSPAGPASARSVIATVTGTDAPTRMHSTPAGPPPPSPIRSRPTKTSTASGGCAATWVVNEPGWKARMCELKVRRNAPTSVTSGTSRRYSVGTANRPAMPTRQPSISASENVQASAVR